MTSTAIPHGPADRPEPPLDPELHPGSRLHPGPADDHAWDQAVVQAYGLQVEQLTLPDLRARVFRSHGRAGFANAPYLEYGGVTASDDTLSAATREAIEALRTRTNAPHVLLKSGRPLAEADEQLVIDESYVTFTLDLTPGPEVLWTDALGGKTRNQVRKAERGGFRVVTGREELLAPFYAVLSTCWRDLGTPTHGHGFFDAIAAAFGDQFRLHLIYDGEEPIAGALTLDCDGVMHHPFAGTLRKMRASSVNNLLYWTLIQHACARGVHTFDLGRSSPDAGTWRFKRSWGAKALPLYYHYFVAPGCPQPTLESPLVRLATRAWRYCPLPVTRALGPYLIRHVL